MLDGFHSDWLTKSPLVGACALGMLLVSVRGLDGIVPPRGVIKEALGYAGNTARKGCSILQKSERQN